MMILALARSRPDRTFSFQVLASPELQSGYPLLFWDLILESVSGETRRTSSNTCSMYARAGAANVSEYFVEKTYSVSWTIPTPTLTMAALNDLLIAAACSTFGINNNIGTARLEMEDLHLDASEDKACNVHVRPAVVPNTHVVAINRPARSIKVPPFSHDGDL